MESHEITIEHGGPKSELGWIQAHCVCGWASRKEYNYNDYQHSNLREQEAQHRKEGQPCKD